MKLDTAEKVRQGILDLMNSDSSRAWGLSEMADTLGVESRAIRSACRTLENKGKLSRATVVPVLRFKLRK